MVSGAHALCEQHPKGEAGVAQSWNQSMWPRAATVAALTGPPWRPAPFLSSSLSWTCRCSPGARQPSPSPAGPPTPYPGPTYNSILLGVPSSSPATLYSSHPRPKCSQATAPRSFTHIHAQPRSSDTKASSKFPRNPPGHHGIRKGRNVRSPPNLPCSFPPPLPLPQTDHGKVLLTCSSLALALPDWVPQSVSTRL